MSTLLRATRQRPQSLVAAVLCRRPARPRAAHCGSSIRQLTSSPAAGVTLLAALVERSPQLTPTVPAYELEHFAQKEASGRVRTDRRGASKVYPAVVTTAEEGPDQERARLRMEALVEREGSREGEGDRTGDARSLDRRLAQRLFLLVRIGDRWQFPQEAWRPPESARDGLSRALEATCGTELAVHALGNAPLAHVPRESGATLFLWRFLHIGGQVADDASIDEYAWLTKEEVAAKVADDAALLELTARVCGPFD